MLSHQPSGLPVFYNKPVFFFILPAFHVNICPIETFKAEKLKALNHLSVLPEACALKKRLHLFCCFFCTSNIIYNIGLWRYIVDLYLKQNILSIMNSLSIIKTDRFKNIYYCFCHKKVDG